MRQLNLMLLCAFIATVCAVHIQQVDAEETRSEALTTDDNREKQPSYPDIEQLYSEPFDEKYFAGTIACGWDALYFWMRDDIYHGNIGRLENPQKTQFERLLQGKPAEVQAVNSEIIEFCRMKQEAIEAAWREPERKHPAFEVCDYQTQLIPLAIIALRVGERLTWEAHQAIKDVILAFRPQTPDVIPAMYMHAPGYNGGNAHDYLGMPPLDRLKQLICAGSARPSWNNGRATLFCIRTTTSEIQSKASLMSNGSKRAADSL